MIEGIALGVLLVGALYFLNAAMGFITTEMPDFWHAIHKKDGQP